MPDYVKKGKIKNVIVNCYYLFYYYFNSKYPKIFGSVIVIDD